MRRTRHLMVPLVILPLFLFMVQAYSQPDQYCFTHFNTSNSTISYDGISKITQDSRGYIWIGTFNGLNRFDGSRFEVYFKDALGLESDFIHTILEDSEGNLWVGTDNGVTRYIYKENRFEAFKMKADNGASIRNKVTFLYLDSKSRIWIVANYQGCFCYDPSEGSLVNYGSPHLTSAEYSNISYRRMVEDENGGFWVSKYHSSLMYAETDFYHLNKIQTPKSNDYFKGDQVEQMWFIHGRLVIASNNHGVSSFDPSTQEVTTLFSLPDNVTLVDAYLESDNNIWLCTTDGVWKYSLRGLPAVHIVPDSNDPLALSGHYVYTAFVDRDGGVWLGSKDGGVSYCGSFQQNIAKVSSASGRPLTGCIVTGFATDGKGTVWVTTEGRGLLKYDVDSREAAAVPLAGVPSHLCFACYDEGKLWLGSLDGLYRYDTRNGSIKDFGHLKRSSGVIDPRVYTALKTRSNDLYFTNTLGLFRYVPESDDFYQISAFDGVFITSLAEDSDGTLWVSSYAQGVFHYDPQPDEIIRSFRMGDGSGLPSDKIASVFIDKEGVLWTVGFSCGLCKLEEDGCFKTFNRGNAPSIPSDVFFDAVQDSAGNIWLSSDKGLVKCSLPSMAFSTYSLNDGLLGTKLTKSLFLLESGEILSGCDNGFIHFNPMNFPVDSQAPEVIISKIEVGNHSIEGNADLLDEIRLKPSQNSFGFQFSLMSFGARADCRVKCYLEGYDRDWEDVTADKSQYYFNVPAGAYHLHVLSSCDGVNWEETHSPIDIVVLPTFFASFPGIMLIMLGFGLILAGVLYAASRRQKIKSEAAKEAIRKAAEEESFRDKMNFFSHVVHEIKTPLTLIRTPLQSIVSKNDVDEETRHDLQVMQNNTDYLTTLVNELLEFVRVERSGYVLNRQNINLSERLTSILFNYQDTATSRNIRLDTKAPQTNIWVNADAPALDKIVNNILINALKHAETRIEVSLSEHNGSIILDVSNDGDIIPDEYRQDVFKPFVQYHDGVNKLRKGVGIGLPLARSLARMHSGEVELLPSGNKCTTFRLTLPGCEVPLAYEGISGVDVEEESTKAPDDTLPLVLVVDDNGEMRDFICRKLGTSYSLLTAKDADEALGILGENNIDMIITDISMPGKDGLQLCREIRANVENSHIPIIILSARTSVESKILAMEAGADLYIEKPFDLDYLRISVKNILDRRSLMRKAISGGVGEADITIFGLPKRDEEFFQAFDRLIMDNISNSDLSNEFLAERLNMGQSTMVRKIRKLLNTTPSNYVRNKRLAIAAKMLRDPHGNNITDICYGVGFNNVSYFAKCFKEQYGVTPSEWFAGK